MDTGAAVVTNTV